jgi:hypothetical protein
MNPSGVRVLVPLGRLGDARQALADRVPLEEEDAEKAEDPGPA